MLYFLPALLAWQLWSPLDSLPYLICLVTGALLSVLTLRVWLWPRFAQAKSCLGVLFIGWAPLLAIGVGLGANVLLDSSPAVRHRTVFKGYELPLKGPSKATFASWRTPNRDETLTCTMFRDDWCADFKRGEEVVVSTRRGALGWEWISDVATAGAKSEQ